MCLSRTLIKAWAQLHQRAWLTTPKRNVKNFWEEKYKAVYETAQSRVSEHTLPPVFIMNLIPSLNSLFRLAFMINWRPPPLAMSIKNILKYLHGPVKSLYNGG